MIPTKSGRRWAPLQAEGMRWGVSGMFGLVSPQQAHSQEALR